MTPTQIKAILQQHGLLPNRALGQNFLADETAAQRIADASGAARMPVLEIGPGLGALTEELLRISPHVTAVEIDAAMVGILRARFPAAPNFTLLHEDFLKTDLSVVLPQQSGQYAVAANLPYYITTPICLKLLTCAFPAARMVLMMQKEAAQRFTTLPGTRQYGPLGVLARLYYEVEILMELSPAHYYPQPEVDSVVLTLSRRQDAPVLPQLPQLLDAAFAMRRKTLANNLCGAGLTKDASAALLEAAGIPPAARAEALPPEAFARLAELYAKN